MVPAASAATRQRPSRARPRSRLRRYLFEDAPASAETGRFANGVCESGANSSSRARRFASPMSRMRCGQIFCRQRRRTVRAAGGRSAGTADKSSSFLCITAPAVSVTLSPSNACRPVSISKRTQPKAQTSVRLSSGSPRACSGAHVRRRAEDHRRRRQRGRGHHPRLCTLEAGRIRRFHRLREPEVEHLHRAVGVTLMFAGFRSRWMMPCSCAASSASAICSRSPGPRRSGSRPRAMRRRAGRRPRRAPSRGRDAASLLESVDRGDVRMIERRERLAPRVRTAPGDSGSSGKRLGRIFSATSRCSSCHGRDRPPHAADANRAR